MPDDPGHPADISAPETTESLSHPLVLPGFWPEPCGRCSRISPTHAGNPHLGAVRTISAAVPLFGNCLDIGQRRPDPRFRQTPGPEPVTVQHGHQKSRFEIRRSGPCASTWFRGGNRQHGVVRYRQVDGIAQPDSRNAQNPSGLKTAPCLWKGQRGEPDISKGPWRICGAVPDNRLSIRNPGLTRIGFRSEWREPVLGNG